MFRNAAIAAEGNGPNRNDSSISVPEFKVEIPRFFARTRKPEKKKVSRSNIAYIPLLQFPVIGAKDHPHGPMKRVHPQPGEESSDSSDSEAVSTSKRRNRRIRNVPLKKIVPPVEEEKVATRKKQKNPPVPVEEKLAEMLLKTRMSSPKQKKQPPPPVPVGDKLTEIMVKSRTSIPQLKKKKHEDPPLRVAVEKQVEQNFEKGISTFPLEQKKREKPSSQVVMKQRKKVRKPKTGKDSKKSSGGADMSDWPHGVIPLSIVNTPGYTNFTLPEEKGYLTKEQYLQGLELGVPELMREDAVALTFHNLSSFGGTFPPKAAVEAWKEYHGRPFRNCMCIENMEMEESE